MNLENVTHEEAVATLKATHDRVILVIAKMYPPIAVPSSPHPCKYRRKFRILIWSRRGVIKKSFISILAVKGVTNSRPNSHASNTALDRNHQNATPKTISTEDVSAR